MGSETNDTLLKSCLVKKKVRQEVITRLATNDIPDREEFLFMGGCNKLPSIKIH